MSDREQRSEVGGQRSEELELRGRINGLYARRGEEVRLAREIRESVGRATGAYDLVWHRAEALTREIAAAEAELEKFVSAEVGGRRSEVGGQRSELAWRDAAVEKPDDEITVMLRLASEGDEPLAVGHHADDTWWINGADPVALGLDVIGWMHVHEAAAILDHATRSNARGEVAHG
jgi:hypothetical protein